MNSHVAQSGFRTLVLLIAFLLALPSVYAQVVTADILGTVTDASGAVIPGAKVTVVNVDTRLTRSMNASSSGDYVFNLLPPGTYTVRIENEGFKAYEVRNVQVSAGDRTRIDGKLEMGQLSESIEVKGGSRNGSPRRLRPQLLSGADADTSPEQ